MKGFHRILQEDSRNKKFPTGTDIRVGCGQLAYARAHAGLRNRCWGFPRPSVALAPSAAFQLS